MVPAPIQHPAYIHDGIIADNLPPYVREKIKKAALSAGPDVREIIHKYSACISAICIGYYRVDHGDTLTQIAEFTGTEWPDLARLNGLHKPYLLQPGQLIRLR